MLFLLSPTPSHIHFIQSFIHSFESFVSFIQTFKSCILIVHLLIQLFFISKAHILAITKFFFLANTHKMSKSERERPVGDLSRMSRLLSKDNYNVVNVNARKNKSVYTATEVACGWAGAVIKKTNPSIWAGAAMQKPPAEGPTDRPTDRPTDTHKHTHTHTHTFSLTSICAI